MVKTTEKNKSLDDINNRRIEEAKIKVASTIRLLSNPIGCLNEERVLDTAINDIAMAINTIETVSDEVGYACHHFEWDDLVCDQIDEAAGLLGQGLAILLDPKAEDYDPGMAGIHCKEGMTCLAKALATLVRWFED